MISIADLEFDGYLSATRYFKTLLREATLNEPLVEPLHSRLLALVQRHPNAAAKIGKGVGFFTVELTDSRDRRFVIYRTDGSSEPFSVKVAMRGTSPQALNLFYVAARHAVAPSVSAAKADFFKGSPVQRCSLTGKLFGRANCKAQHQGDSLSDLVDQFLLDRQLTPQLNWFIKTPKTELKDAALKQDWIAYYCDRAVLTFVHHDAKRSKAA